MVNSRYDASKVAEKIQKIFDIAGVDATFKKKTHTNTNSRGETTGDTFNSSSITVVPYNANYNTLGIEELGQLNTGDGMFALKSSVNVEEDDHIEYDGEEFVVTNVKQNTFAGTDLLQTVETSVFE